METKMPLACFKAYDIRGRIPSELNPELAYKVGRAYAQFLKPKCVAVGHDIRLSSPEIAAAVTRGLTDAGVDVLDIGLCGTEQVYFATFHLGLDGGIMTTASHNPADYNGMKLVREGARPISCDTGLADIERRVIEDDLGPAPGGGTVESINLDDEFVKHLLGYIDVAKMPPMKIVVNAGNGGAGRVIDLLEPHLPFEFVKIHHEPDGNFPNGVPNPLLPDNRQVTADAVVKEGAALGIAWDGDFDRCFLFDEKGGFIEGYYIVGLLATGVLAKHPGSRIVHDPRLTWNTVEIVKELGGEPIQCKSGHAFLKDVMRREDAAYGGEMSAHHFFREFSYCDSGMIPWMLVTELIASGGKPLSALVGARLEAFPASGEINRRIDDPAGALVRLKAHYGPGALLVDETDGLGVDFETWRFNLRLSNTEPLIRLNVESRGDRQLMEEKTQEILALLT
jgi:phosphomannomutase